MLLLGPHHSVLDRDVALAVIKTEGLDETSRTRILSRREILGRGSYTSTGAPAITPSPIMQF